MCVYAWFWRVGYEFTSAFSSLVEDVASDGAVFDIEGSDCCLAGQRCCKEDSRKALEAGCKANVAAAPNPDAAIHAALNRPGITVINPGEESKYLGGLPLNALCASLAGIEDQRASAIMETVELWGVRCFRDLAALPEAGHL